jgi:outer membrane lipoprotein-sorting protein
MACNTVTLLTIVAASVVAGAQQKEPAHCENARLNLDQVLTKLEQNNADRAAALQQFEGKRIYRMDYHGLWKDREAEMEVKVRFRAPDSKQFTILSQSGSQFVIDHVFKKLLEAEQQATAGENGLTRENYNFELVGYENDPAGGRYVLSVTPKTKNKFLYRGKIWVDSNEFAVVRIEGEPGKNPSMWITKSDFSHRYMKVDNFWLPAANYTESSVRFGGKSTLSIEYQDYKIIKVSPIHIIETAQVERSRF